MLLLRIPLIVTDDSGIVTGFVDALGTAQLGLLYLVFWPVVFTHISGILPAQVSVPCLL